MEYVLFDLEADGLEATLIHCVSIIIVSNDKVINKFSLVDYKSMREFFLNNKLPLVGHNIIRYDIPTLEKILGISLKDSILWDTLAYSWYLFPERKKHGLEFWGKELGIKKPEISDWRNLKKSDYVHRCEKDVEINLELFRQQLNYLRTLYQNDDQLIRLMNYLSFKLDCAREQEEVKWKLDIYLCKNTLVKLEKEKDKRFKILSRKMPPNIEYKVMKKPSKLVKRNGDLSKAAITWYETLEEMGYPRDTEGPLKVPVNQELGNPGSPIQLKEWLFLLGWKPEAFKISKNTGEKVPQINLPFGGGICPSIKKLYNSAPHLEELEGLYVIKHRIGVLNTFLYVADNNNFVKAKMQGLTNTLRFQHTDIVNLPGVDKPYGEEIRGSLIAPNDDYILCGSDVSSLEDSTKQHYMYYYDPDYVNEMRVPGFDPHLDIAVLAEMLTKKQSDTYKRLNKLKSQLEKENKKLNKEDADKLKELGLVRKTSKVVNFAGVYGAGAFKISEAGGFSLSFAKKLHSIYWQRNKAVKLVSKALTVRSIDFIVKKKMIKKIYDSNGKLTNTRVYYEDVKKTQMWLYNPVSHFWYSLRFEKDKFSTLNQGTGVYVFDTWVKHIRGQGLKLCGQFHDEIIAPLHKSKKEEVKTILTQAMDKTNNQLKLNVPICFSVDFGQNYSQIH